MQYDVRGASAAIAAVMGNEWVVALLRFCPGL
jgi:hypothetical protein